MASMATTALLLLALGLVGHITCQGVLLCQKADDRLASCALRMSNAMSNGTNLEGMCSATEEFLLCEQEVKIRCPDNAILNDPAYRANNHRLVMFVNRHCPRNLTEILCEANTFHSDYASICQSMVMTGPPTSLEGACSDGRRYLSCMERVNAPCPGVAHNLDNAIAMATTAWQMQCSSLDLSEGPSEARRDLAAVSGAEVEDWMTSRSADEVAEEVAEELDCSNNGINAHIALCSRHIMPMMGNVQLANKHVCRYSRRYLRCILRLMDRCPTAEAYRGTVYEQVRQDMVNLCETNSGRCPFDVSERQRTILEYCSVEQVYTVGSDEFCRYVANGLPKCLVRTKNRCRDRGLRYSDIRSSLVAANMTFHIYCDSDVAKRSTAFIDIDALEMEERSNAPADEADGREEMDAAIFDGDEVNQVERAVRALEASLDEDPQSDVSYLGV